MMSDQAAVPLGGGNYDQAVEYTCEFVRALYRGYLNREPGPDEVAYHAGRLAQGETEAQVIASFAESEEARLVAEQRSAGTLSVDRDGGRAREVAPLTIRADDVLRVIAQGLTRTSGREPSFDEVAEKFTEFERGADLATLTGSMSVAPPTLEDRDVVERIIALLYARTLHRTASPAELEGWYNYYTYNGRLANLVSSIADSDEARRFAEPAVSLGVLVQLAHEIIFHRGANAYEVDWWRRRLEEGTENVTGLLFKFFFDQMDSLLRSSPGEIQNNPGQAYLFGSRGIVDAEEWNVLPDPNRRQLRHETLGAGSMFAMEKSDDCVVSVLTSLYKGGDYIRSFLENITSQSIFRDHCELIIVDACSPQKERKVIAEFQREFPNIVYKRCDTRVGIYEAWNIAARLARGRYCTNANLDDCRRTDSLEIQAATLDSLSFADVVYQEVLYSFRGKIPFEEIEAHDLRTKLPVVSRYNLMEFNSPHNAPMWRRSLHDEIGYFDEMLTSAGDYDFWMRCLLHGKAFYKTNAAHVGYYVNPEGLSTRPDTRGMEEARAISRAYYRDLISPLLTAPHNDFIGMIEQVADAPVKTVSTGRRYDIIQAALRKLGSDSRIRNDRTRA